MLSKIAVTSRWAASASVRGARLVLSSIARTRRPVGQRRRGSARSSKISSVSHPDDTRRSNSKTKTRFSLFSWTPQSVLDQVNQDRRKLQGEAVRRALSEDWITVQEITEEDEQK